MDMILIAIQLVTVHMIDGREVQINPKEVVRMQEGREDQDPKRVMVEGVRCVIWFTDGKYLSVSETCPEVRDLIGKE